MPLHTLIAPEQQRAILQSLLAIYEKEGWLPDAWVAGDFGSIQGGTNVDVVFADAVAKDLGGFDQEQALKALRHHAEHPSDNPKKQGRYLEDYLKLGYVTSSSAKGATSRSLEYAYNDFCIAKVAEAAGDTATARKYRKRSQGVFKLFNKEAGHFWAKDQSGNWQPDITTENLRKDHWNDPYFYEATPLPTAAMYPTICGGLSNGTEARKFISNTWIVCCWTPGLTSVMNCSSCCPISTFMRVGRIKPLKPFSI